MIPWISSDCYGTLHEDLQAPASAEVMQGCKITLY